MLNASCEQTVAAEQVRDPVLVLKFRDNGIGPSHVAADLREGKAALLVQVLIGAVNDIEDGVHESHWHDQLQRRFCAVEFPCKVHFNGSEIDDTNLQCAADLLGG